MIFILLFVCLMLTGCSCTPIDNFSNSFQTAVRDQIPEWKKINYTVYASYISSSYASAARLLGVGHNGRFYVTDEKITFGEFNIVCFEQGPLDLFYSKIEIQLSDITYINTIPTFHGTYYLHLGGENFKYTFAIPGAFGEIPIKTGNSTSVKTEEFLEYLKSKSSAPK